MRREKRRERGRGKQREERGEGEREKRRERGEGEKREKGESTSIQDKEAISSKLSPPTCSDTDSDRFSTSL